MKFAKRVSSISNEAIINEEMQPELVIAKLKKEVAQLKELTSAQGSDPNRELTTEEKEKCKMLVQEFIEDGSQDMIGVGDLALFRECFILLRVKNFFTQVDYKDIVTQGGKIKHTGIRDSSDNRQDLQDLQLALKEKERQLHILVAIVNKKKEHFVDTQTQTDNGTEKQKPSVSSAPTKMDLEQIIRESEPKSSLVRALSTPLKTGISNLDCI
jgi:kinesin family protein 6/9